VFEEFAPGTSPRGNRSRLSDDRPCRTESPGVEWRAKPHGNLLRDGGLLYNGSDNASGAQTGRRGGAGPAGGLPGGKGPTRRFFLSGYSCLISSNSSASARKRRSASSFSWSLSIHSTARSYHLRAGAFSPSR